MRPLKADFVAPRQVPRWAWAVLAAVMLGLAAYQGWQSWQMEKQSQALRGEAGRIAGRIDQLAKAREAAIAQAQIEVPYARDAAEVAHLAGFELAKVLGSLEAAQVEGVRVTAVEISAGERSARVELEFSTHEGLLRYLDDINAGEPKRRWSLLEAQSAGAAGLGSATIASVWNGAD